MKIQPKKIWRKGNDEFATELKIMITDNCIDSASIQYYLYNENDYALEIDKLNMSGEAYENWDSNDYVYNWVANILGLELISE
jgi:hypothetical protein